MVSDVFVLGVVAYCAAVLLAVLLSRKPKASLALSSAAVCIASLAVAYASASVLLAGTPMEIGPYAFLLPQARFHLYMDRLSAVFVLTITTLAIPISIFSIGYIEHYIRERSASYFGCFYSTFILSMVLTCVARNIFWFLLFWELMTASSYFLVIYEDTPEVRRAGYLYFLLMHVGFALIAVALFLGSVSTGFDLLALGDVPEAMRGLVLALCLIGFGMKAGIVPLHVWLPEAYPAAPSNVSALLSGATAVGVYGLARVGPLLGTLTGWWSGALAILGLLNLAVGVTCMLGQLDFKRFLAYSSIAEAGMMALALAFWGAGSKLAEAALLMHVVNHAYAKGLLFALSGLLLYACGTRRMNEVSGLLKASPLAAAVLLGGALNIMGAPPLGCFFSKLYVLLSGFTLPQPWGPATAVLALCLELTYFAWFLRALQHMAMGEPTKAAGGFLKIRIPPSMWAGLLLLLLMGILSGISSLYLLRGVVV